MAGINEYALGLELRLTTNAEKVIGKVHAQIEQLQQASGVGLSKAFASAMPALGMVDAKIARLGRDIEQASDLGDMKRNLDVVQSLYEQLEDTAASVKPDTEVYKEVQAKLGRVGEIFRHVYAQNLVLQDKTLGRYRDIQKVMEEEGKSREEVVRNTKELEKEIEKQLKQYKKIEKYDETAIKSAKELIKQYKALNEQNKQREKMTQSVNTLLKEGLGISIDISKTDFVKTAALNMFRTALNEIIATQEKFHTANVRAYGGMNKMTEMVNRIQSRTLLATEAIMEAAQALIGLGIRTSDIEALSEATAQFTYITGASTGSTAGFAKSMQMVGASTDDVKVSMLDAIAAQKKFGISGSQVDQIMSTVSKNMAKLSVKFGYNTQQILHATKSFYGLAAAANKAGVPIEEASNLIDALTNNAEDFVVLLGSKAFTQGPEENLKTLAENFEKAYRRIESTTSPYKRKALLDVFNLTEARYQLMKSYKTMGKTMGDFMKDQQDAAKLDKEYRESIQSLEAAWMRMVVAVKNFLKVFTPLTDIIEWFGDKLAWVTDKMIAFNKWVDELRSSSSALDRTLAVLIKTIATLGTVSLLIGWDKVAIAARWLGLQVTKAFGAIRVAVIAVAAAIGWPLTIILALTAAIAGLIIYSREISDFFGNLYNNLKDFEGYVRANWGKAGGPIGDIIAAVGDGVAWIRDFFDAVAKYAHNFTNGFRKSFDPVIETLKDAWEVLKNAFNWFVDSLGISSKSTKKTGKDFEWVIDMLWEMGVIVGAVARVLVTAFAGVMALLGPILISIGTAIKGIIQIFWGAGKAIGGLVEIVGSVFMVVAALFSWDAGKLKQAKQMFIAGVKNLFGGLWTLMKGFFNTCVGWLAKPFVWLYDYLVGKSILWDLYEGIKKVFEEIGKIVKGVAEPIEKMARELGMAIEKALKGADEIVTDIGEAIGKNITKAFEGVKMAAEGIGDTIVRVFRGIGDVIKDVTTVVVANAKEFAVAIGVLGRAAGDVPYMAGPKLGSLAGGVGTLGGALLLFPGDKALRLGQLIGGLAEPLVRIADAIKGITGVGKDWIDILGKAVNEQIGQLRSAAEVIEDIASRYQRAASILSAAALTASGALGPVSLDTRDIETRAHSVVEVKLKEDQSKAGSETADRKLLLDQIHELVELLKKQGDDTSAIKENTGAAKDILESTLPEMVDNVTSAAARGAGGKVNTWG